MHSTSASTSTHPWRCNAQAITPVPFDAMRHFIKKDYLEKYDEFVGAAKAAKAAI